MAEQNDHPNSEEKLNSAYEFQVSFHFTHPHSLITRSLPPFSPGNESEQQPLKREPEKWFHWPLHEDVKRVARSQLAADVPLQLLRMCPVWVCFPNSRGSNGSLAALSKMQLQICL